MSSLSIKGASAAPNRVNLSMYLHHPLFRPLAALAFLLLIDLLLVPGLEHTTPDIDRLKAIAHHMGIEVRPLIAHVDKVLDVKQEKALKQKAIRTAGVGAASPTQRIAPVVQPTV